MSPKSVIGVWATASRTTTRVIDRDTGTYRSLGKFQQISRLGNPLVNEVINPMAREGPLERTCPRTRQAVREVRPPPRVGQPHRQRAVPGRLPEPGRYVAANSPAHDLAAILLTGIPAAVIQGFQNYTGPVQADMLRLNVAVPPTARGSENPIGLVAGDAAGFPNGRRLIDDITAIELKAVAGATIPLVDPGFTPDAAAGALNDGTTPRQHALRRAVPVELPVPVQPQQRVHVAAGHARRRCLMRATAPQRPQPRTAPPRTRTPARAWSCSTSAATSAPSSSSHRESMVGVGDRDLSGRRPRRDAGRRRRLVAGRLACSRPHARGRGGQPWACGRLAARRGAVPPGREAGKRCRGLPGAPRGQLRAVGAPGPADGAQRACRGSHGHHRRLAGGKQPGRAVTGCRRVVRGATRRQPIGAPG